MPIDPSHKAKKQHQKNHLRHLQRIQNTAPQSGAHSLRIKRLSLFQLLLLTQFIVFVLAEVSRDPLPKSKKDPRFTSSLNFTDSTVCLNHSAQNMCSLDGYRNTPNKVCSTLSFFSPQQSMALKPKYLKRNKEERIERIARKVCNKIHEKKYHFYSNPPGTSLLVTSNSISFFPPEDYDLPMAKKKISILRNTINSLQQEIWGDYQQKFKRLLDHFNLSEKMRLLAQDYFDNDLQILCYLRLCSAYFDVFKGGNCNEISAHVTYKMLVAFYRLNSKIPSTDIPSIAQLRLIDRDRPDMNHAISAIKLKKRSPQGLFFDSANQTHHEGFICDPWFYQGPHFIAMEDLESHSMLSSKMLKYTVLSSYEVGNSPNLSSLPEKLQDIIQNLRDEFIKDPYEVPEEEQETLRQIATLQRQRPRAK